MNKRGPSIEMIHRTTLLCFISIINTSLFVKDVCAYSNSRQPKIIGGKDAVLNQFPYMVSIRHNKTENTCGGGIIDDRFILTAAHCIISPVTNELHQVTMKVILNKVNVQSDPGLEIDVEKAYVLRQYKMSSINEHDIGILKLKESLDLANSQDLKKLDLPRFPESRQYVGKIAVIAGFGYNLIYTYLTPNNILLELGGYSYQRLRYANVTIITNKKCKSSGFWTGTRDLTPNHICGQIHQSDPDNNYEGVCTGDSGSPLVVGNTVIGVVSASPIGCNETVNAAKYTRVSHYLNFIRNVLKNQLDDDILELDVLQPQKPSAENIRED